MYGKYAVILGNNRFVRTDFSFFSFNFKAGYNFEAGIEQSNLIAFFKEDVMKN